jgi:hypothetical protein
MDNRLTSRSQVPSPDGCTGLPCLCRYSTARGTELFRDVFHPARPGSSVVPAEAGIQAKPGHLDPGFRRGDDWGVATSRAVGHAACFVGLRQSLVRRPGARWSGSQDGARTLEAQEHPFGRDILDEVLSVHPLALDVPPAIDDDHAVRLGVCIHEDVQRHLHHRVI